MFIRPYPCATDITTFRVRTFVEGLRRQRNVKLRTVSVLSFSPSVLTHPDGDPYPVPPDSSVPTDLPPTGDHPPGVVDGRKKTSVIGPRYALVE